MRVRTVVVDGHGGEQELAVAEAGVGGRPLVLLHGFTGAKEDFSDWLDALAALGWHAIAPDQRGHGESAGPHEEEAYSFDSYATDLLALLDAMGWPSAVVLGHSMGGLVVQTAVLRSPERFDALVLMDTSHRALRADAAIVELAAGIATAEGMGALLAAQNAVASADPLANEIHDRLIASRPGYREFCDGKLLASSPVMYAAMVRAMTDRAGGLDRLPELGSITVPTLVLVGEADKPFRKPSQRLADAIPGADLVVIPDAGHAPQHENPDLWWKALSEFLGRLQAP